MVSKFLQREIYYTQLLTNVTESEAPCYQVFGGSSTRGSTEYNMITHQPNTYAGILPTSVLDRTGKVQLLFPGGGRSLGDARA